MRIRDEIRLGVGTLLFVQVLVVFAAVGLLARMTPAIDQILEDNERSIHAVERMLTVLAEPSGDPRTVAERELRFMQALDDARGNITDERETQVIATIEDQHALALAGDPGRLQQVRRELSKLGEINRSAMHESNLRAKRLGTAGVWILIMLGLVGLSGSIAVMRRFQAKLIRPVYELGAVLQACSEGDLHRRFNPADASSEFSEVAEVINSLVGEHFGRIERDWEKVAKLDRSALLWLLDRRAEPTFVCGEGGAILASNHAGLDALRQQGGPELRDRISRGCRGEPLEGVQVEALRDVGWVCTLAR